LKAVSFLFAEANTSPLPDLRTGHQVGNKANGGYFWDIIGTFLGLGTLEDLLHLGGVRFKILNELMVITIILNLQELVDIHLVLNKVTSLLELVQGLARVVEDQEVEELLEMLLEVALAFLVGGALEDFAERLGVDLASGGYR